MQKILETGEYVNRELVKNNRLAAGAIFYCQVASMFFHGFFIRSKSTTPVANELAELFTVSGVAILVLIGFALIFSPAKNNLWSSIGFTLLITALTFQLYDLSNTFWTLTGLTPFNRVLDWNQTVSIYLSNRDSSTTNTLDNTAIGALKCALANSITFAAIMGRAGLLEAFVVTFCGTAVYQLNRQLVLKYALDFGGSITIFCWGGIYGSMVSLMLYWKKHKKTAQQHELRMGGKFSYTLVFIGALFCWVFFPFLNTDIPPILNYNYQAGINCFYSMTASVLACASFSSLINGQLSLKDVIYSPVVGGVIIGSSAAVIQNTAGALILGIVAGISHALLQRWQKKIKWHFLIQNNVLFLYGIQGMMGGFFSAILVSIAKTYHADLYTTTVSQYKLTQPGGQIIATGITIGIALVTGLVVGILLNIVNKDAKVDHYHDRSYWIIQQDCISQAEDIHINSDQEIPSSQETDLILQKDIEVYREIVIHQEKDFRNKFVHL